MRAISIFKVEEVLQLTKRGMYTSPAGQVFVYTPSGELIDMIEVPERPSLLLFGGQDGRALFLLAVSA